jgi:hypothetical protein
MHEVPFCHLSGVANERHDLEMLVLSAIVSRSTLGLKRFAVIRQRPNKQTCSIVTLVI